MLPLAAAAAVVHPGWPFFPFFFLIPLLWFTLIVVVVLLVGRGARRRWAAAGGPPWAQGRSAEQVLGERFANGDIDEREYRARLEVLRASRERPR
jgi:putative membrane protein